MEPICKLFPPGAFFKCSNGTIFVWLGEVPLPLRGVFSMGNCASACAEKVCGCLFRGSEVTYIAPPFITLDTNLTGKAVTLSDRNTALTGEGCSLGGCSLQQDRAYFEIKIVKNEGSFQIGIGSRRVDKDKPLGALW